jgi:hypothetical protein
LFLSCLSVAYFQILVKFQSLFFQKFFSKVYSFYSFSGTSLFWSCESTPFVVLPRKGEDCSSQSPNLFSLCHSDWVISTDPFSNALILLLSLFCYLVHLEKFMLW